MGNWWFTHRNNSYDHYCPRRGEFSQLAFSHPFLFSVAPAAQQGEHAQTNDATLGSGTAVTVTKLVPVPPFRSAEVTRRLSFTAGLTLVLEAVLVVVAAPNVEFAATNDKMANAVEETAVEGRDFWKAALVFIWFRTKGLVRVECLIVVGG